VEQSNSDPSRRRGANDRELKAPERSVRNFVNGSCADPAAKSGDFQKPAAPDEYNDE
jgi:hypothetical protein